MRHRYANHALTLTLHILKKSNSLQDKILAFDPIGEWLTQWRRQLAALEIGHLRSPAVHHRDPNPYELRRFAENRSSELFPPYDLPGSRLFEEFCGDTIKRWQVGDLIKAKVTRIQPKSGRFRLWFVDGKSTIARRVIVAAGSGKPHLPAWANQIQTQHPAERIRHSEIVKSLPVLDKHLPWPGCELFLTGGLAALQVGPVARNLAGARMAGDRIVPAIVKSSIALSPAIISQQSLVINE